MRVPSSADRLGGVRPGLSCKFQRGFLRPTDPAGRERPHVYKFTIPGSISSLRGAEFESFSIRNRRQVPVVSTAGGSGTVVISSTTIFGHPLLVRSTRYSFWESSCNQSFSFFLS